MSQEMPGKKVFIDSSFRKALQQVQNEFGYEAIILSCKTVDGNVVIEATSREQESNSETTSPDQAKAIEANKKILLEIKEQLQKLTQQTNSATNLSPEPTQENTVFAEKIKKTLVMSGFHQDYSQNVVKFIEDQENYHRAILDAGQIIARDIPVINSEIIDHQGAIAFVGGTGVGKTTIIAKLAARFLNHYGKDDISLISSDFYRVGGREQLRIYGNILDVPVHMVSNIQDLEISLEQLRNKRLVLIDTAGVNPRDIRLTQKLNLITHLNIPLKTFLVFPTAYHRTATEHMIDTFHNAKLSGAIVTKIDECPAIGEALSVCINKQLPINYLSIGSNVPGDIKIAKRDDLIRRALPTETDVREFIHG